MFCQYTINKARGKSVTGCHRSTRDGNINGSRKICLHISKFIMRRHAYWKRYCLNLSRNIRTQSIGNRKGVKTGGMNGKDSTHSGCAADRIDHQDTL